MQNDIKDTASWFVQAVEGQGPTQKQLVVQLGVHFEEVAEMIAALDTTDPALLARLLKTKQWLVALADDLKKYETPDRLIIKDRTELLDAICDQIVTATGVGIYADMRVPAALAEVNRSNFSKFVDGKPIRNENGKIIKGPDYSPPQLTQYI